MLDRLIAYLGKLAEKLDKKAAGSPKKLLKYSGKLHSLEELKTQNKDTINRSNI